MYTETLEWNFVPGPPRYEEVTRRRGSGLFGVAEAEVELAGDGACDALLVALSRPGKDLHDSCSRQIKSFMHVETGDLYTAILHHKRTLPQRPAECKVIVDTHDSTLLEHNK